MARYKNKGDKDYEPVIPIEVPTFTRTEDPSPLDLPETFIDRYTEWGYTVTDAPKQYHTLNAVVILSTILSPYCTLRTSFGDIKPNIWTMILAGTTVTRKSTSMDMAIKVLDDVHPDYSLGNDGSPEGLMSELAFRDGKISLFHRDEITGFIDAAGKKDYLAGLLELFTRLYDGKKDKRSLRKETIEINKPCLVIMSGGIKTRMQELITIDHIRSGFIPRFIITSGTTTTSEMRSIGPPVLINDTHDPRDDILNELRGVIDFWMPEGQTTTINIGGMTKKVEAKPIGRDMQATPEAWERIQQLEVDARTLGEKSTSPEIFMPVYTRLAASTVKVAMLIAGSRLATTVSLQDVTQAIRFANQWLVDATAFATAVESQPEINPWEKKADKILMYIRNQHPERVTRSDIMQRFRVKQKDVVDIEATLVGRNHIKLSTAVSDKTVTGRGRVEYILDESVVVTDNTFVPAGQYSVTDLTNPHPSTNGNGTHSEASESVLRIMPVK